MAELGGVQVECKCFLSFSELLAGSLSPGGGAQ